jgi:hypothetical protein
MSGYKNIHLTHFEDLVFTGQIDQLLDLTERLMNNDPNLRLSRKIDGSPSIVIGINPENNRFFVGMKSTFAVTPKVFYTPKEVQETGYNDAVKKILISVLDEFSKHPPEMIVQGDFLFLEDDLVPQLINGKWMLTFTPNTITYAIPELTHKKMGIMFHTAYKGETLKTLNLEDSRVSVQSDSCWTFNPSISHLNLDVDGMKWILNSISRYHIRHLNSDFMENIVSDDFIMFYNYMIRNEIPDDVDNIFEVFAEFVDNSYEKKILSLRSVMGQDRWREKRHRRMMFYYNHRYSIEHLFCLHGSFLWIKQLILNSINSDGLLTLMKKKDRLIPTNHEGLVIMNDRSSENKLVKLVDRREFSYANFNKER